jgi:alpha-tubulin suppressor-like RCC1 family protein
MTKTREMAKRRLGAWAGAFALLSLGACGAHIEGGGDTSGPSNVVVPHDGGTGAGGGGTAGSGGAPTTAPASFQLAAGGDNTCVLSQAGHVACWGSGETGQLGLGDFSDQSTPVWIPNLDGVVEIAVADMAMCARKADGSVWCWGMNFYQELGTETPKCNNLGYQCSTIPVQAAVSGARRLAAGAHHVCAVLDGGKFECWGAAPPADTSGYVVHRATAGYGHTCALFEPAAGQDPARNVICFGDNDQGQYGIGTHGSAAAAPVAASDATSFLDIAAGESFTCGIDAFQKLYCWGDNQFGELGIGASDNADFPENCGPDACATHPVQVMGMPAVMAVAAHFMQACAVTANGDVYCWGTPSKTSPASAAACFQGSTDCSPTPQIVAGVPFATWIAVGYGHACAATPTQEIYCWGLNTHGQLGHGSGPAFSTTPLQVVLPPEPM